MDRYLTDLADVLRAAGLTVDGCRGRRVEDEGTLIDNG